MKDWGVESTANWVQVHFLAFETRYFSFVSFLTSFCKGSLAELVLQGKLQGLFV